MTKTRVLIVDDAVVVRRLLADALSGDPALEVVGTAPNGRIALAKITQVNPDVVVLDMEMPEMDGVETLAAIRKSHPLLPVILFSQSDAAQATARLNGSAVSANGFVSKPGSGGGADAAWQRIQNQLIPRIKQAAARPTEPETNSALAMLPAGRPRPQSSPGFRMRSKVEIVAIGSSTGGPNALSALLPIFPTGWPVPMVIVQHMPPVFTHRLAERLASQAAIGVGEGIAGAALDPGHAWLAPGDYHMVVAGPPSAVRLRLHQAPPENSCRPSVDVLFRSVAETYGPGALAVVLTGMGQDGLRGCEQIRAAGGQVVVQDEASSVVWGMPGYVARAGLADLVLPLDQLGAEIVRRVQRGRSLAFHP